jgi:hypothetical protein
MVQRESLMVSLMTEEQTSELREQSLKAAKELMTTAGYDMNDPTAAAAVGIGGTAMSAQIGAAMVKDVVDAYGDTLSGTFMPGSGSIVGAKQEDANKKMPIKEVVVVCT